MSITLHHGDCRSVLPTLPAESVQCVVTSPPYFGLRDYGVEGQIGLEPSPAEFVAAMVEVFAEVWRVLRPDGTAWLNLGDSYNAAGRIGHGTRVGCKQGTNRASANGADHTRASDPSLKPKDLMLIPARVAIALQDWGWWVRSEIIWHKQAPMPESVRDRPTCAHEKVWLLTKSARYFYDAQAVREPFADERMGNPGQYQRTSSKSKGANNDRQDGGFLNNGSGWDRGAELGGRNLRNVWSLPPEPSSLAHFAMMPTRLAETCIKAGSRPGDTVLDPFAGAGTTLLVADRLQRHAVGIELNPDNCRLIRERLAGDAPLFAEIAA